MPTETFTIDTTLWVWAAVFALVCYLIGSLSSAVIYAKLKGLPDPRKAGSGNPGATNVLRVSGKKAAAIVLIGDLLKGALPVLFAKFFLFTPLWISIAAIFTILGHLYPVFFKFQGGKGVATAAGICLAIYWPFGLAVIAVWLFIAVLTRTSALSALAASGAAPILAYVMVNTDTALLVLGLAALIIWKHRANIKRLREGTEPKIGLGN